MTLRLTAISMMLSLSANCALAGLLGCKEDVEAAGQGQQAQLQVLGIAAPDEQAPFFAEEEVAFAPSVFNTVKRYMGIKAPVHNNVAPESATFAARPSPLGSAGSKLAHFAEGFGKNISELAEVAVSAGQLTLGKLAPMVGFDLNKPVQRSTGVSLVADVGLRQQGSNDNISFASSNPTLKSKLDKEREQERIQQLVAAPATSIKWQPAASLGLSYRFE